MGHLHMWAPSVSTVAVPGSSTKGSARGAGTWCGRGSSARVRGCEEIGRGGRGALNAGRLGCEGVARPDSPRRWTLPITALRVTPPSCLAIWLADRPSIHNFLSVSTRSSVQPMAQPPRRPCAWSVPTDPLTQDIVAPAASDDDDLPDIVNNPLTATICGNEDVHRIYILITGWACLRRRRGRRTW